ncbi:MAG: VanW family protein, partial [Clostridia bacterium]|nr:VanW family protein [Clostridia bacterium]
MIFRNTDMEKKKKMKKIIVALIAASMILALTACSGNNGEDAPSVKNQVTVSAEPTEAPTATPSPTPETWVFPSGSKYGDKDISGMTVEDATKAAEDYILTKMDSISVKVLMEDGSFSISGDAVEIAESNIASSFKQAEKTKTAATITPEYKIAITEDTKEALREFASEYECEAKDATVSHYDYDNSCFVFNDSVVGKKMDLDKTVSLINKQFNKGVSANVTAEIIETEPKDSKENLESKFGLISSFSTYSYNTDSGNHNMALAMNYVNGTILNPGEQFSFEETIGDSTKPDGGWQAANGIVNGVLTPVYGGGICQASTTLYVAVLKAGLQIDDRECHSMPSSYVDMGLDATVSYQELDFKFTNSLDYPIYIEGYMDGLDLHCNIYGVQPDWWDYIELSTWTTETIQPEPGNRYIIDDKLNWGEIVFKEEAQTGYKVDAARLYYKDGELVLQEALDSSYYPEQQPTYAVPPGTDIEALQNNSYDYNDYYYTEETDDDIPEIQPEEDPVVGPDDEYTEDGSGDDYTGDDDYGDNGDDYTGEDDYTGGDVYTGG